MFDITIIGAGVVGANIARLFSQYKLNVLLLEKENDVSLGASKANSGIVHGGYAGKYGTMKGDLCIKGNQMFDQLNQELNFGFKRIGGIILGFEHDDRKKLEEIIENGLRVGQDDFKWLNQEELLSLEPNCSGKFGIYSPSIGICSPYEMTIALVENAIRNGVALKLGEEVIGLVKDEYYTIRTKANQYQSKIVINASGINSDKISAMAGYSDFEIKPRRGQYIIFGKDQSHLVNHVLFQPPTKLGKGILVTPTVHGNFMIGPDAEDLMDNIDTETSIENLEKIIDTARLSINDFKLSRALTTFSGIRAISESKDFVIEQHDGFINVAGIDSPGLTSSPAIALYVKNLVKTLIKLEEKIDFKPYRESYYLESNSERVCYCEDQCVESIIKCFEGPIDILTTDAVKRRIRAGMGNCQGDRCFEIVKNKISEYYNISENLIVKRTEETMPKRVSITEIRKLKG